jgi:hypothetical protein
MTAAYVRPTPDVVFAVDVFPAVDVSQTKVRPRKRAVCLVEPDGPAVDPRQIDDAEYAPA